MPRHKRLQVPGAVYHVITRGIERGLLYKDDADREEFLGRLSEGLKETGSKCYGWVLMPNHFHLLIRTGTKPLSDLMRKVLTGYAVYFNRRHRRRGYLYQNRYKSIMCQEETYFLELVRYIHLNPLRARIVKGAKELGDYAWSGHGVLLGNRKREWQSTDEVLERFGETRNNAISKYEDYINDAKDMGHRDDLAGGGLRRSAGGWVGVMALKKAKESWRGDERILGDGEFVEQILSVSEEELIKRERLKKEGWNIERVMKRVSELLGIPESEIRKRSRGGKGSAARGLIAYWANKELGISCVEIGNYFGITKQSVNEAIPRGEKVARESEYQL